MMMLTLMLMLVLVLMPMIMIMNTVWQKVVPTPESFAWEKEKRDDVPTQGKRKSPDPATTMNYKRVQTQTIPEVREELRGNSRSYAGSIV